MNINIQITLGADDSTPAMTPAEMLTALGGDPAKDSIGVSVQAGHTPPPPETAPASAPGPIPPR